MSLREKHRLSENHQKTLARRIYAASNIKGQFRLRSGAVSDEYFDKYLFESDPMLLREIAQAMSELIPLGVDALAGLEMGGIPIVTVLSQITGIPALFVRKRAKEYGTRKLVEGGEVAGRRLVIIEDIVTSAGQIRESARALRELGAEIVGTMCVVDREEGGRENLAEDDLALHSLYTMTELKEAVSNGVL
jgi:orotate phosphoribosyltransferase